MTIQELIDRLEAIENKDMDVCFYKGCFYYNVEDTEVKILSDGKEHFNLY